MYVFILDGLIGIMFIEFFFIEKWFPNSTIYRFSIISKLMSVIKGRNN
jgi:hypothetical protein